MDGWILPALTTVILAALSGLGVWVLKLDNRQYKLQAEVVTRTELDVVLKKIEDWLVRVEHKLDEVIKDRHGG